jgi:hypothetical protein
MRDMTCRDDWLRCSISGRAGRFVDPFPTHSTTKVNLMAYFRPVIDELRPHPAPEGYLDYLRLKLRQAAAALPPI